MALVLMSVTFFPPDPLDFRKDEGAVVVTPCRSQCHTDD